jgi:hypothetical protein
MKCVMDEVVDEFIVQEQLTLGGDLFGSLGKQSSDRLDRSSRLRHLPNSNSDATSVRPPIICVTVYAG